MIETVTQWFKRRFVNTEFGNLMLILVTIVVLLWWIGDILTPVLASIIIAYLLDGLVQRLKKHLPKGIAIHLVYFIFLGAFTAGLFFLLPLIWEQLYHLFNELPLKLQQANGYFTELSQHYPTYISKEQIQKFTSVFQSDFSRMGKAALSFSISTVSRVITLIVYLILVPLMVYFFLKDRDTILKWASHFLPQKRQLMRETWGEINQQLGYYIRAKILEILLVGVTSTLVFVFLGLHYAILLGVLVGLSALVPYVGVVLVTIPVVIIAYLQWGFNIDFLYLLITYIVIMLIDGNVLTPLLFAGTMKLHPVAVIVAILFFGGLWGFWGIFFAIPLASVVKVLVNTYWEGK